MSGPARSKSAPRASAPGRAWQRMLSGRRLDLLDPSPLDIEIEDIAHGLARVARWNGQTRGAHAFSVAQHSLLVVDILAAADPAPVLLYAGLLHDAPEYVIGDMISPFKATIGEDYRAVEHRLLAAIHLRFGLPMTLAAAWRTQIKVADRSAAFFEATRLAGFGEEEALRFFGEPGLDAGRFDLDPWPATEAEARFLQRHAELAARAEAASGGEAR